MRGRGGVTGVSASATESGWVAVKGVAGGVEVFSSAIKEKSSSSKTSSGSWRASAAVRGLGRWRDAPELSAERASHTWGACRRALKSEDLLKVRRRRRDEEKDLAFGEGGVAAGTSARLSDSTAASKWAVREASLSLGDACFRAGSGPRKSSGEGCAGGVSGEVDALLEVDEEEEEGFESSKEGVCSRAGSSTSVRTCFARVRVSASRGRLREARDSFRRREMDERERDRSVWLYACW